MTTSKTKHLHLTDKFFDVKGIKELYDILMKEVYGDGGFKGY